VKAWKKAGLSKEQAEIVKSHPGLLDLSLSQAVTMYRDDHSLFHGEAKRMRCQERYLAKKAQKWEPMGYSAARLHENKLFALHDFFVGDVRDVDRETISMYRGTPNDYERNLGMYLRSIQDVEQVYVHLKSLAPEEVRVNRRWIPLRKRLMLSEEVRINDPLELLRLTRSKDRRIAHQARCRLILTQACFGARRDGYAPDELETLEKDFRDFIDRRFFEEPEGQHVHVVAELDPHDNYVCKTYQVIEDGQPLPDKAPHRFFLEAERRTVPRRRKPGAAPLQIFFFLRHKQRMLLKMMDKNIVFPQLAGIGDPLAMMFVVEREDLSRLVAEVREVLVPNPGMVAESTSSIGHRLGSELTDRRNRRSSNLYEAMKYVSRMQDRMVEVQFLPMAAWINALAARSDVNHGWYKMKRYLASAYPTLYPTTWSGIPWSDAALKRQCINYTIGI